MEEKVKHEKDLHRSSINAIIVDKAPIKIGPEHCDWKTLTVSTDHTIQIYYYFQDFSF